MNLRERRNNLLNELEAGKRVYIKDLAKNFDVSEMTVRRDLNKLSALGLVTLVHGGAVFNEGGAAALNVTFRERQMQREKNLLGQYCSTLIGEGNSVYLHCGSTLANIADALLTRQNIAVISNSLQVLNMLSGAKNIQLIALAGIYEAVNKGFYGDMTQRTVKNFRIDIAFLGADAVSLEHGLMLSVPADAGLVRAVLESARKKILVTDHTKINREAFLKICDMREFNQIITDKQADEDFIRRVRRTGVEVVQV